MTVVWAQLPEELNNKLTFFAKKLELAKEDLINKAVESYIIELQEDEDDYQEVIKRLSQNSKTI